MADAVIRIKFGELEVEYQGDAAFLEKDLLATIKDLLKLQKEYPIARRASLPKGNGDATRGDPASGAFDHSTHTIANLLNAKTGPELAMAAAAHLHFVKGKPKFKRREIVDEMRTATGRYKKSFHSNMTPYLNQLTKGDRLRSVGSDTYSLSNEEARTLEAKLAED
jgi:hypothetical protein